MFYFKRLISCKVSMNSAFGGRLWYDEYIMFVAGDGWAHCVSATHRGHCGAEYSIMGRWLQSLGDWLYSHQDRRSTS